MENVAEGIKDKIIVDREINLKGEVCPYTFVRSKLAIEEMESGQVLRVILDHLPAVSNVPKSLSLEGNEILRVEKLNGTDWEVVIRKK
jgi:TusA-related sulfurtransferase